MDDALEPSQPAAGHLSEEPRADFATAKDLCRSCVAAKAVVDGMQGSPPARPYKRLRGIVSFTKAGREAWHVQRRNSFLRDASSQGSGPKTHELIAPAGASPSRPLFGTSSVPSAVPRRPLSAAHVSSVPLAAALRSVVMNASLFALATRVAGRQSPRMSSTTFTARPADRAK